MPGSELLVAEPPSASFGFRKPPASCVGVCVCVCVFVCGCEFRVSVPVEGLGYIGADANCCRVPR